MNDKIVNFSLDFLASNVSDPDVEAMAAVALGLADCEEEYEGNKFEKIYDLINQARRKS